MHWYAVSTKPHQEHIVEANLEKVGIETFCPRLRESRIIRRSRQITINPLFPGYVFAKFCVVRQFRTVVYARGVRNVVAFGSTPAKVDQGIIENIQAKLRDGHVVIRPQMFKTGQVVRIQEGPLCGLEAVFEREMSGQQRAMLLLRTLAYQARVVVDLQSIVNL